ncbi:hypothetical protein ARMGADRAFT_1093007 [Armillaria gallica]|uniref:Uncharacterized protein n=1 Tax=Armillaria gallica TaxID=47427 RepID=A0A2H3CE45_ARMGA|nr:hypothetical protein ARMGADRAFT_1093007 [Armillaria gallica]
MESDFAPRRCIVFRRARPGYREEMGLKDRKKGGFKEKAGDGVSLLSLQVHARSPFTQPDTNTPIPATSSYTTTQNWLKEGNSTVFCPDTTHRRPASKVTGEGG